MQGSRQRKDRIYQPAKVTEADVELMPAANLSASGTMAVICRDEKAASIQPYRVAMGTPSGDVTGGTFTMKDNRKLNHGNHKSHSWIPALPVVTQLNSPSVALSPQAMAVLRRISHLVPGRPPDTPENTSTGPQGTHSFSFPLQTLQPSLPARCTPKAKGLHQIYWKATIL